jgi:hypothetical protein
LVGGLAWLLTLAQPTSAQAQAQSGAAAPDPAPVYSREADGRVVIRATRVTQAPRIDGRLDDAVYREVPAFSGFIQADPAEGEPETEKTEAYVFFDDRNVYVAVRCWDAAAAGIVATEMRRDHNRINQNDHVAISFDTFYDGRNGFQFTLTAAGGLRDGTIVDEGLQADWNGIYEARASRDDQGWSAEYAIPFKTLRYPPSREQTWHIQLRRVVRSNGKNEMSYIAPMKAVWGLFGSTMFAYTATLVGLEAPAPGLNLEIKPYVNSALNTDLASSPSVRNDFSPDAGVDVKYGITKSLTADFTYNTDFAQVEIDEAQINLTRFNLNFPEKREFFLEGQGLFDFGRPTGTGAVSSPNAPAIFYSRRIGLSGSRAVPVIGGGRLTGRAGPWVVGAFNMETDDDEMARAAQTNFTVVRVRRNILRRSNVGGIYTRRSVSTVGPGANDVAGLDLNLGLLDNVYVTNYIARSRTDALNGDDLAYRSLFHYNSDRYGVALDRHVVEANFNPEVGFMRRPDFRRNFVELRLSPRPRNHPFVRRLSHSASLDYITNNRNVLESRELQGTFRADFHSGDSLTVEHARLFELLPAPFQIAPAVRIPVGGYDFHNTRVAYTAGGQRGLSGTMAMEIGSFYSGDRKALDYRGRVDLSPQFGMEPTISFNWIDLPQGQFHTAVVGGRAVYTMSPRMLATALVQHNSSTNALSTNLRFRWEYQPGSELFVVFFEGRSTEPPRGLEPLQNRGFIVKVNRLFRW